MQKRDTVQLARIMKWSSKREEFPENKKKMWMNLRLKTYTFIRLIQVEYLKDNKYGDLLIQGHVEPFNAAPDLWFTAHSNISWRHYFHYYACIP